MKNSFFKKLTALLLGTIMVLSMIPAIAISTKAAEITVSVTIGDYAKANGWADSQAYKEIIMDDYITVTASGSGNTAKYYNNGSNWRFYQTDKSEFSVTAKDGATIQSVKVTYSISNNGVMTYNGANKTSNSVITVNGTSATFGVGNTGTKTNGQVRVTAIQVVYSVNDSGCEHEYTDCEDTTCNLCDDVRTAPGHIYDNCEDTECNNCTTGTRDALEHVYTNDYDASCNNCTAERTVNLPATGSTLDIPTALLIGAAQDGNTAEKYYIEGVVTSIYNTTYGNMYIEDADGNEICVYGSYDALGENRFDKMTNPHKVGDTVRVYGALSAYKGNGQMVNGWVTILPKFEGFGLTLNKGITIRVKLTINAEWIANNPDAKVMFTDALGTQLDPIAGTNYYSITLTPGDIDRNIKVTYCDINEDVRVETYILKAREQYADDEALMLLLDAITAYGQAANGEYAPAPDFTGVDAPEYDDDINLFGGILTLDAVLNGYANIGIAVNATENLSYTISLAGKYASKGDDLAAIVTDGKLVIENLRPANFNDEIVLTVTNAEGNTATATFTFNEYLKALYDIGNEYQNMAAATYNYGVAVEAYVAATAAQQ